MERKYRSVLGALSVALFILGSGPSFAGESRDRESRNRDRQTQRWAMPSQSMRNVLQEEKARKPAEAGANQEATRPCPEDSAKAENPAC